MSTILGIISVLTYGLCFYVSYRSAGEGIERYGVSALLATIFMLIGFELAIYSLFERFKFTLFKVLGLVFNLLAFILICIIVYIGIKYSVL